jgi:hypothetical protein
MGIDVLELDEDGLLPTLGTGDWLIALPDNHPDLVIAYEWRRNLHNDAARKFVRWVMGGIAIDIRHHNDPSWDQSGEAYRESVDPLLLLTRHENLQQWLDNEYTGNSRASYVSGMGLFWDTYDEDVSSDIDEKVLDLIKTHLQSVLDYDEDDDIWMDILDEITWVQSAITRAIRLETGLISTKTAWQNFNNEVRFQLEEQRRYAMELAARHNAMRQKSHEFWHIYFADLEGQRIEQAEFRAMKLANRLREVLTDTDPDIIEAIVEVGLPASFSKSVAAEIQDIAKQALK